MHFKNFNWKLFGEKKQNKDKKNKDNRRKCYLGKKGSKLFFMCPELIIIVLLDQQSLQVGGKG